MSEVQWMTAADYIERQRALEAAAAATEETP